MTDDRNHPLNEGRESLFDLEDGELYLLEGTHSGVWTPPGDKEGVSRYSIENVLIKPYRTDLEYEHIPVVAYAGHLNFIRKDENLQYIDTKDGSRNTFIGRLYTYETKGVKRKSFKVFRDANLLADVKLIEKRIRSLNNAIFTIPLEESLVRVGVTMKKIERLRDALTHYIYVPWTTQDDLAKRVDAAKEETTLIQKFVRKKG